MTELERYAAVNACVTLGELAAVIKQIGKEDGYIQGRTQRFNAEIMAQRCVNFDTFPYNVLTRTYGIRQQAMYISYYSK